MAKFTAHYFIPNTTNLSEKFESLEGAKEECLKFYDQNSRSYCRVSVTNAHGDVLWTKESRKLGVKPAFEF